MKTKILTLGLICSLMVGSIFPVEKKKKTNPWQELFTEPIEKVYIIMKDKKGFEYTSHDEIKVHMSIGRLEKTLKKVKNKNYSIKDIAIIIHNHLKYCHFSDEDHKQYMRLKQYGFNGLFLLYCQRTNKTCCLEDKKKIRNSKKSLN